MHMLARGTYNIFLSQASLFTFTMGPTSGAGTAYPSGAPEFPLVFNGFFVTRSLVLCVSFVDRCLSFCTLYLLVIVLSVLLRFTDSDYPSGIFKLFFVKNVSPF